ncbi:hypothetical protein ERO13_A10G162000v2 [Gossypium hirsutum]|uniref:Uncharacterized protein n=4 Tax=Gossypium TaxID=3633 RepID=A0A5D2XN49_GOSMU|nr:hypothetical protein ES319_A10G174600v1 [Gossypium barbadense]KAG4180374.1 hypothetical protein ERO13_A10G162000v2 [Gossypium hirsutum]TYG99435.1 hypothetical protein ES288_A10G195000v1 [Gossypium darwinii]TYI06949.1 hypothetical protein ES332_A10G193700v1 [Gossypium tomentosum]TYJ15356.1 hypothetical protein E1A91_A10G178700v1 [Gossypium mustelinum]
MKKKGQEGDTYFSRERLKSLPLMGSLTAAQTRHCPSEKVFGMLSTNRPMSDNRLWTKSSFLLDIAIDFSLQRYCFNLLSQTLAFSKLFDISVLPLCNGSYPMLLGFLV